MKCRSAQAATFHVLRGGFVPFLSAPGRPQAPACADGPAARQSLDSSLGSSGLLGTRLGGPHRPGTIRQRNSGESQWREQGAPSLHFSQFCILPKLTGVFHACSQTPSEVPSPQHARPAQGRLPGQRGSVTLEGRVRGLVGPTVVLDLRWEWAACHQDLQRPTATTELLPVRG